MFQLVVFLHMLRQIAITPQHQSNIRQLTCLPSFECYLELCVCATEHCHNKTFRIGGVSCDMRVLLILLTCLPPLTFPPELKFTSINLNAATTDRQFPSFLPAPLPMHPSKRDTNLEPGSEIIVGWCVHCDSIHTGLPNKPLILRKLINIAAT